LKAIKKTCNPVKSVLLKGVDMRHVLIFKPSSVPDWTIIYVLVMAVPMLFSSIAGELEFARLFYCSTYCYQQKPLACFLPVLRLAAPLFFR
jgi:hypothetical protein